MEICDIKNCSGCLACMNSCPKDAISIGSDEYGAIIPKINETKCVNCGICQKVCPVNTKMPLMRAPKSYAAWSEKDIESSSGGVAAVMSRYIVNHGGVVYGAAVVDKKTKHIRVSDEKNLYKLRGSKYVQSEIGFAYREVKNDLQKGLRVLFTGTPCQIAGLKAYLKHEYENLVTVDLICHGVPPHKYLEEHLDQQTNSKWDSYSFRGIYNYVMTAYADSKIVYQKSSAEDLYFQAFLKGLSYRENCFHCPYARPERVSDLTIGDFWGLDRTKLENQYNGRISVVLPNTEKGQRFFDEINPNLIWEERTFNEAISKEQGNLVRPSSCHKDREIFLKAYRTNGFDCAVENTEIFKNIKRQARRNRFSYSLLMRGLRKIKQIVKRVLKRR